MGKQTIDEILDSLAGSNVPTPRVPSEDNRADNPIDKSIISWIQGLSAMPKEIKSFGEDAISKMNWSILYSIVKQFSRINTLIDYIDRAEGVLFSKEQDLTTVNKDTLMSNYNNATKQLTDLLELSRKFGLQNKDLLRGSSLTEEQQILFDIIRSMDQSELDKLKVAVISLESKKD